MPSTVLWLVTLPIAILFGFILFARFFRRRRKTRDVPIGANFGIDELHKLMTEGKLSPEEFERARLSVLVRSRPVEEIGAGQRRAFEVRPVQKTAERSGKEAE